MRYAASCSALWRAASCCAAASEAAWSPGAPSAAGGEASVAAGSLAPAATCWMARDSWASRLPRSRCRGTGAGGSSSQQRHGARMARL